MDEVVGVMQNNVSKVMERGDRLEDLQDQSGKIIYINNTSEDKFTDLILEKMIKKPLP